MSLRTKQEPAHDDKRGSFALSFAFFFLVPRKAQKENKTDNLGERRTSFLCARNVVVRGRGLALVCVDCMRLSQPALRGEFEC